MKIAVFHELPHGGARRGINEFSRQLKKRHKVDLYVVDEKKDDSENKFFDNIFFYKFIPKHWIGKNWRVRLYKDTIELLKIYKLNREIASAIKKKNYDLILVNASRFIESPFILLFKLKNKVFYCHDPHYRLIYEPEITFPKNISIWKFIYEKLNRYIRKVLDKRNIYKSDFRVINSKFAKNIFHHSYKLPAHVSYYGVDTDFFKSKNVKKDIDILYIGSYQKIDGYDLLQDSLKMTTYKPNVKIVAFEDNWLNDKQILNLYQRSKIVLAFARKEPFGLIPIEAMACGVPVIAVNEGGYKESIIDKKTGYLVERQSETVAKKLDFLLSHESVRKRMGIEARKQMLAYWTWEKRGKELESYLESIIKK